uniref:WAT1-related protein n=2 Tax=Rhizophora mucronata TaxID=61149 RepID=A0A2P2K9Z5_RHIMU
MVVNSFLVRLLPFAAMVMLEILDVGLTTISKAAMSRGMSHFIFVLYSNALATLILFPSSFIFLRNKRPPITFPLLCKFFILSLLGVTIMQNCVSTGVDYSSPTLASAMGQLIPPFTFVLAVTFRMEKLDLKSSKSQIKILSTVVSVLGALIIILYKGPPLGPTRAHPVPAPSSMLTAKTSWVIGGLFLVTASLSLSTSTIFQAAILKDYPSEITIVSFYCLFGTIQCAIVCLFVVRDPNAWKLRPDVELISVIYSAVFGNLVTFVVMAWCIVKKGPVFVATFKPLGIAIAALLGVFFLGDTLHVGSILGAIVIVAGFYGVIWAQSKEEEKDELPKGYKPQSSSQKTPLLETHSNA